MLLAKSKDKEEEDKDKDQALGSLFYNLLLRLVHLY